MELYLQIRTAWYLIKYGNNFTFLIPLWLYWQPLCSSGQSSWLQIQRPRVRFPGLPDFLRSSGSGTGSTQPREYNWRAAWKKISGSGLKNRDYGRMEPSRWPRDNLYQQKLALTSPKSGGRSVGIVRSWTQATELLSTMILISTYCPLTYTWTYKAIPATGRGGLLQGCEMLRTPYSLDNRLTDSGNVVSPTHRPRFTPQKHYFSVSATHFS
jgi:hypothetical protein